MKQFEYEKATGPSNWLPLGAVVRIVDSKKPWKIARPLAVKFGPVTMLYRPYEVLGVALRLSIEDGGRRGGRGGRGNWGT